jgi:hypothetical protein
MLGLVSSVQHTSSFGSRYPTEDFQISRYSRIESCSRLLTATLMCMVSSSIFPVKIRCFAQDASVETRPRPRIPSSMPAISHKMEGILTMIRYRSR